MPKLKTSKSAIKRIKKITKEGKILTRHMSCQHRNWGKSKGAKQRSARTQILSSANVKTMKKLIKI